jgi:hypothetical protein
MQFASSSTVRWIPRTCPSIRRESEVGHGPCSRDTRHHHLRDPQHTPMGYGPPSRARSPQIRNAAIFTRFRRRETSSDGACGEDRCRPADVARRPPAPVAPMGASRARHVNGSRCRPGSAWFRSNDRSCSVRAVLGLPPRSDRGSRRADAVVIRTTLFSRQDLTVVASFGFKVHRQMRRQGGRGRPDGLAGSRTERGETKRRSPACHHPGSAAHHRGLAVRACCGANLLHGLPAESSRSRRPDRLPEAARRLASPPVFGNTTTNASSSYVGMLTGGTTCEEAGDTAAHRAPALLRKHGTPIPRPIQNRSQVRGVAGR